MIITLSVVVALVIVQKQLSKNHIIAFLNRHAGQARDMMLIDLREFHRKRIATLKANHNQTMRKAQEGIGRLHSKFGRLNSEYDCISAMYQDQIRTNQKQEDRIAILEMKLKEFRQLSPYAAPAPFSAPASQINFPNPPHRARGAVKASSSLLQSPLVQVQKAEEE